MDDPVELSMTQEELRDRIMWCIEWPDGVVGAYHELLRRSEGHVVELEARLGE